MSRSIPFLPEAGTVFLLYDVFTCAVSLCIHMHNACACGGQRPSGHPLLVQSLIAWEFILGQLIGGVPVSASPVLGLHVCTPASDFCTWVVGCELKPLCL